MASATKRTSGIVVHVSEHYGFIELTNKNLPISKVHFDRSSICGRVNDLSKDFPRGTHVNLTFVPQSGNHDTKYHAINLEKDMRRGGSFDQGSKYPHNKQHHGPNVTKQGKSYPHEGGSSQKHQNIKQQQQKKDHRPSDNSEQRRQYPHPKLQQSSNFHKHDGGTGQMHQNEQHQQKSNEKFQHGMYQTNPFMLAHQPHQLQQQLKNIKVSQQKRNPNSHEKQGKPEQTGAQYPHCDTPWEWESVRYEREHPSVQSSKTSLSGGGVGQILREALASGFSTLAQKIGNAPPALTTDTQHQKLIDQNENIPDTDSNLEKSLLFLMKYLSDNGATLLSDLLQKIKSVQQCPEFLKSYNVTDVVDLARQFPAIFTFKCGFFCLVDLESAIFMQFYQMFDESNQSVSIDVIRDHIKPDSPNGVYLYCSKEWIMGVQDFIARHSEHFVFWNSTVWKRESPPESDEFQIFESDCKAVKYYSKFVEKKSALSVTSLSGHFAQAPADIKNAVKSDQKSFSNFLSRNSFFFNLTGDCVTNCGDHRFSVCWMDLPSSDPGNRQETPKKKKPKGKKVKIAQASETNDSPRMEESTKAFADGDAGSDIKISQPCSEDSSGFVENLVTGQCEGTVEPALTSEQSSSLQCETSINENSSKYKPGLGIYKHQEAKILRNVLGRDLSQAIKSMLISQNQPSINNLLLVRLNIGRKPSIRLYSKDNETSNHTLTELKESKLEDLQRILRHKDLVNTSTPLHYGIKGTLHSLRTIEQGGKLTGLTIFCQIHEHNDGLGLEIIERKGLTAVVSNVSRYPQKLIYNYLRSKVQENSQNKDVLVLDVDGQLSGCEDRPHSSLCDVTRISCASSSELSSRIIEVIEHLHEYVVVINVESVETLQALQKMCSKGAHVIAEISPDVKTNLEDMFGL